MKRYESIMFEESDYELLRKDLPRNPCSRCHDEAACCGCPQEREYDKSVAVYKEAGIYNIALILSGIKDAEARVKELQRQISDDYKQLTELGVNLTKLGVNQRSTDHEEVSSMMAFNNPIQRP